MTRKELEIELAYVIRDLEALESLSRDLLGPYQRASIRDLQAKYKELYTAYDKGNHKAA